MAKSKFSALARLTALGAALAVSTLGIAGAAQAATPGNIDPNAETSLTLHKFETPDPAWTTENDGNEITVPADAKALAGVQFKITPVTEKGGAAIDLTTPAGWDLIEGATPAAVQGAGWTLGTAIEDGTTKTDANGAFTKSLPKGLYLVQETGSGNNLITGPTPDFLVTLPFPDAAGNQWIYNVHVYPKNDVSKDVTEKKVNDPSLVTQPAEVVWDITVPLAAGPFDTVKVTDTLDARLEYKSEVVKQGAVTFTKGDDYTVTGNVVIEFTTAGLAKLVNNVPLEVALTTEVKAGSTGVIENTVDVIVNDWVGSTKPGNPGGPTDPETPLPSTNWGKLEVLKHVAGSEATVLGGAEFAVYSDAAATTQVGTITTDAATGVGSLNLWVGNDTVVSKDYWIKETKPGSADEVQELTGRR